VHVRRRQSRAARLIQFAQHNIAGKHSIVSNRDFGWNLPTPGNAAQLRADTGSILLGCLRPLCRHSFVTDQAAFHAFRGCSITTLGQRWTYRTALRQCVIQAAQDVVFQRSEKHTFA
jgi:hypothetical protein